MNTPALLFLLPYILAAIICGAVAYLAFRRGHQPGARSFALVALFETVWTLGVILQALAVSLPGKLFWNNVQFLGAVLVPLAYAAFGFEFSRRRLPPLARRVALGLASLLLLFIWTDGLHHLFRTAPHLSPGEPFASLVFADGPAFNLYTLFGYSLVSLGTYALLANFITAPRIYRLQAGAVLAGILIPWVTTLLTWLRLIPLLLHEVTPVAFALSNIIVAWALFRYRLFDLVPVAHHTLFTRMDDGVIVLDGLLRVIDLNPAAQRILGLPLKQALGRPLVGCLPVLEAVVAHLSGKASTPCELSLPVGGETRLFELRFASLSPRSDPAAGCLVVLGDITPRKQAEQELRRLAITDSLTGLYNRRHFFELAEIEFERATRTGAPLSLVLFDIDHFKQINDTHGHRAGDQVLSALAVRCREALRGYDILARYGGEEFVVLLPETALDQAAGVAERLRRRIAGEPFACTGQPVQVTVSLGVASLGSTEWLTLDQLIDRADQALYDAKHACRNRVSVWEKRPASSSALALPPPD